MKNRLHPTPLFVGLLLFSLAIVPPVRAWVEEAYTDIQHWAEFDKGGHFAAFEVPDTFVADLRACFAPYRS